MRHFVRGSLRGWLAAGAVGTLISACTGSVGSGGGNGAGSSGSGGGNGAGSGGSGGVDVTLTCAPGIPTTTQLRRMLNRQYDATVRDLLGVTMVGTATGANSGPPS